MAPWDIAATISTLFFLKDISDTAASGITNDQETPILGLIAEARSNGYDAVALPLATGSWKERWSEMCLLPPGSNREMETAVEEKAEAWRSRPCFLQDEVTITRLSEASGVTVMISDWLQLDAADHWVRHDAEIALQQELAYAAYLNVESAILPAPRNREHVSSYARIVNSCLNKLPSINLSIRLPVYDPSVLHASGLSPLPPPTELSPTHFTTPSTPGKGSSSDRLSTTPESELNATWEMWDLIRSICDYNTRLTLTLDLAPPLPKTIGVLSKWAAESIRNIILPSSTFIANSKGYPVLPKPTQTFIRDCMIHYPNVILSDVKSGLHSRGGEAAYLQYVRHLEKTSPAVQAVHTQGTVENFAHGYQDFLQAPLQPLMDNLQSVTYQTFEQDPVKYRHYEEAMYRAIVEWPVNQQPIVFCIAGAGRGPLVARCLVATGRARRKYTIYALEKNPNAFVTLQERQRTEWGDRVRLVFGDMRSADVPEPADILVSELLGSFGDNELSPECLDGAMRFLKPNGISIPACYSAHLAPLSSSKLYNESRSAKDPKSMETPYVVMFQAVNILSGDGGGVSGKCGPRVQECWEFEHPRKDSVLDPRVGLPKTNSHNARSAKLDFYIPHAGVLHGLAGYFEAVLYGEIGLSIHPQRKSDVSKDMLSWFPLFFPFREPLYLPSNSELRVSIWRVTTERRVWYEWHAESFLPSPTAPSASPERLVTRAGVSVQAANENTRADPSPVSVSAVLSPMRDADEFFALADTGIGDRLVPCNRDTYEVVKIGQTGLHNPDGRSSWIGL